MRMVQEDVAVTVEAPNSSLEDEFLTCMLALNGGPGTIIDSCIEANKKLPFSDKQIQAPFTYLVNNWVLSYQSA